MQAIANQQIRFRCKNDPVEKTVRKSLIFLVKTDAHQCIRSFAKSQNPG